MNFDDSKDTSTKFSKEIIFKNFLNRISESSKKEEEKLLKIVPVYTPAPRISQRLIDYISVSNQSTNFDKKVKNSGHNSVIPLKTTKLRS